MNPEKILKPIKTENVEQHEKELKDRLINIQLYFADKKFKENPADNLSFFQSLSEFTPLIKDLEDDLRYKYGKEIKDARIFEEQVNKYLKKLEKEVNIIYFEGFDWQQKIINFLSKERQLLAMGVEEEHKSEEEQKAGLLIYNIRERGAREELFEYGFDRFDQLLEIHFGKFYKEKEDNSQVGSKSVKSSFSKLAELIIDRYPEVKAVTAESWLVDTGILERMGFKTIKKEDAFDQQSTWWQLMDKDGQIKEKTLKEFVEKGELPFKSALGYVEVEEFLKKFLPQDRKGRVVLKDINLERRKELEELHEILNNFKGRFGELKAEEIQTYLEKSKLISEWLSTKQGKEFLDILVEAKKEGCEVEEVGKKYGDILSKLSKDMEASIKRSNYSEREIIIK